MISRRDFLKNTIACGMIGSSGPVYRQALTTEEIELTHINISNPKSGAEFKGYKIAFISDLHCGVFLSENLLRQTVAMINNCSPDLLILGGDYIGVPDNTLARFSSYLHSPNLIFKNDKKNTEKIFSYLGTALSDIKAPDGILAVMGNHDHWNNGETCIKILNNYGIRFLINQTYTLSRGDRKIYIYGADDYWTGIPKITSDFKNSGSENYKIIVSHNPDFIARTLIEKKCNFDLSLSGHTHGGQICINGIGALAGYNIRYAEFGSGLVYKDNSLVFTSRGIGVVDIPLRLNSKPEITLFTL